MKAPFIIGDKLYLRPLESEDAPTLVTWINDPEIKRTLLYRGPLNLRAELEFVEHVNVNEQDFVLGIALKEDDRLIGTTGLHEIDCRSRHAMFGILICKEEWNKGYGTEATSLIVRHGFETLNLNRVWLRAYEYNDYGIRAYEKVGFKKEGILRQENFREGRYWDTLLMAILREEWRPS